MSRVLLIHASFDGQTRKIADRVRQVLVSAGHAVTMCSAGEGEPAFAVERYDAVMVGAGIRYGHHSRALERRLRAHLAAVYARPNGFFSVCLSAGGPGAKPETARGYVEDFCRRTGWVPEHCTSFAGALRYRQYNPLIRLLMRFIVGMAGGETDTSRDYEYTDWHAVEHFAAGFAAQLGPSGEIT